MPTKVKEAVIDMIQRMPDDASVADIMAELYIRNKVDEGLRQLDSGQVLEHEDVQQRMTVQIVTITHAARLLASDLLSEHG